MRKFRIGCRVLHSFFESAVGSCLFCILSGNSFSIFHVFDIFIVMLTYYSLSLCVACRHVLFVLRFVYTGEFISIGSYCNFVVVYLTFSSPFYSIFN